MPVVRVPGGYKAHASASKVHRRKRDAFRQLVAIKVSQAQKAKRPSYK
jgi:hypothetical protein